MFRCGLGQSIAEGQTVWCHAICESLGLPRQAQLFSLLILTPAVRQVSMSPQIRGTSEKRGSQYEAAWLVKGGLELALHLLWMPGLPKHTGPPALLPSPLLDSSYHFWSLAAWSSCFEFFSRDHQSWMTHPSYLQILSLLERVTSSAFTGSHKREKYFHVAHAVALGYRKVDSRLQWGPLLVAVCVCVCVGVVGVVLRWVLVAAHGIFAMCGLNCPVACGILVPRPGMELMSPALQSGFLTAGPPGKSPFSSTLNDVLAGTGEGEEGPGGDV